MQLLLNEYKVSVWDDENVLETGREEMVAQYCECTLMPLNGTLKSDSKMASLMFDLFCHNFKK